MIDFCDINPLISLVNIIAGKRVVKEYIQRQASADKIFSVRLVAILRVEGTGQMRHAT